MPIVVVGFQPLDIVLLDTVFIRCLTASTLSVEWDAKYVSATDITVSSWIVDTTLRIPVGYVSVKYEIIIEFILWGDYWSL